MPGVGAPRHLQNPKLEGLRSWPVYGFPAQRVYYLHDKNQLRIVRVLHGKRDIRSLLEAEEIDEEI